MSDTVSLDVVEESESVSISVEPGDTVQTTVETTIESVSLSVDSSDEVSLDVNTTVDDVSLIVEHVAEFIELDISTTVESVGIEIQEVGMRGAPGEGGGVGFECPPDLIDDTLPDFFFMGWQFTDKWVIRRQTRTDSTVSDVSTGYPDLATAWPDRLTLTYSA